MIDLDPIEVKGSIGKGKNLKLESISIGSENNNLKLRGKEIFPISKMSKGLQSIF